MGTLRIWICCFYLEWKIHIWITWSTIKKQFTHNYCLKHGFNEKVGMFPFEKIWHLCKKKSSSFWKMPGFRLTGSFGCQAHQHAERWDALRNSFPVTHRAKQLSCQPFLSHSLNLNILVSLCGPKHHKTACQYIGRHRLILACLLYPCMEGCIYLFTSEDNLVANCRHFFFWQVV